MKKIFSEKIIRYMALHVGDTAPPGTAWAFNKDIKWVYYTMNTYIRMVKATIVVS